MEGILSKPCGGPPLKARRSPVLLAGGVLGFTLFGDSLLYSVLPLHAFELGIPVVFVGVALSINRWIRIFSNPVAVKVLRRFGFVLPMVLSCLLTVLTVLVYAYPAGVFMLLAARSLWGACWSHLRLGSYLVVFHSAKEKLGLAMGSMQAVSRLGSAFTLLAGGALVDSLGYSRGLTVTAFLSALSLPVLFWLIKSLRNNSVMHFLKSPGIEHEKPWMPPARKKHVPSGKKVQVYLRFAAGFINSFVVQGLVISSVSYILRERMPAEFSAGGTILGIATVSGILIATRHLSTFIISPLLGHLSDRWSRRPLLISCLAIEFLCLLAIGLVELPLWTIIAALLIFIAGSALDTLLLAAVGDTITSGSPTERLSEFATFLDIGAASGPLAGYLLAGWLGFSCTYVYAGLAVFVLFVVLCVKFQNRPN